MKTSVFTIALFLAILYVKADVQIVCPENIGKCKCTSVTAYGLHIVCANFNDTEDLVTVLTNLRTCQVGNLILHNLALKEVLPEGLFQGLQISEITVEKSNLIFPQPAFKGLDESLQRLHIAQKSVIQSSEKLAIAKLTNLTELSVKNNPFDVVKNNWLNGKTPRVEEITLEKNGIVEIESRAFAFLPNLKTISLAYNKIKVVKRSMFPKPAINLKSMDIR